MDGINLMDSRSAGQAPHPGHDLPRQRLARLLGQEGLLPADWCPGMALPRQAVWRLLRLLRQERRRHIGHHWTASLPRLLALESALAAALGARACPALPKVPGQQGSDVGAAP